MKTVYHPWTDWECYPAGFYEIHPPEPDLTDDECRGLYRDLLADIPYFKQALKRVITEWPNSCEHYLSNERMNRIAWLGQASLCIELGLPYKYRGGYMLLSLDQRMDADLAALEALNEWLVARGEAPTELKGAGVKVKDAA